MKKEVKMPKKRYTVALEQETISLMQKENWNFIRKYATNDCRTCGSWMLVFEKL